MNTKIENLLTMPDGIDNPKWGEAAKLVKQIGNKARELYELMNKYQSFAYKEDVVLTPENDEYEYNSSDIQTYISDILEITNIFFVDDSVKEEPTANEPLKMWIVDLNKKTVCELKAGTTVQDAQKVLAGIRAISPHGQDITICTNECRTIWQNSETGEKWVFNNGNLYKEE